MPLKGGASDKAGNRFELRWTVRCLLDLLLGRVLAIRLEPPGEDAIEFRVTSAEGTEIHQAKRGNRMEGRWTLMSIKNVLISLHGSLRESPSERGAFVSGATAPELAELAERALSAENPEEFTEKFLTSKASREAAEVLSRLWATDMNGVWSTLRRLRVVTVADDHLAHEIDTLLGELFATPAVTTRAVLTQLVIESVHKTLDRNAVLLALKQAGVQSRVRRVDGIPSAAWAPPPAPYLHGRATELASTRRSLAESTTVFVGGVSGMGKSALAAKLAAEWGAARVVWIDVPSFGTVSEAMLMLGEYAFAVTGSQAIRDQARGRVTPKAFARLFSKPFHGAPVLIVWDAFEGSDDSELADLVEGLDANLGESRQIITEQTHAEPWTLAAAALVTIGPLSVADATALLCARGITDLDLCARLHAHTSGHPYLLMMAVGAMKVAHLEDVLAEGDAAPSSAANWIRTEVLERLPASEKRLVTSLSVFRGTIPREVVRDFADSPTDAAQLRRRLLLIRAAGKRYRVHDLLRRSTLKGASSEEECEAHQRVLDWYLSQERLSAPDLREMLHQAVNAGSVDQAREMIMVFLNDAAGRGQWDDVLQATRVLSTDSTARAWFLPNFLRGRALRVVGDFQSAIAAYEDAAEAACNDREKAVAESEVAAALALAGDSSESRKRYELLSRSAEVSIAAGAHVALILADGIGRDPDAARQHFDAAVDLGRQHKLDRVLANADQAMGDVLLSHGDAPSALTHLRRAILSRERLVASHGGSEVLAMYHLWSAMLRACVALGRADEAVEASRRRLKIALTTASFTWIAESVYTATQSCEVNDQRVADARYEVKDRLAKCPPAEYPGPEVFLALAKAFWWVGDHRNGLEALLDAIRAAFFQKKIPPLVVHAPDDAVDPPGPPSVRDLPGGASMLLTPPSWAEGDLLALADEVMKTRPDLAPFVVGLALRKD